MNPNESIGKYNFGFILNTTLGNNTRYITLKKYSEHDASIVFSWAAVSHHLPKSDYLLPAILPHGIQLRFFVMRQAMPVINNIVNLDAIMVHLFESEVFLSARSLLRKSPLLISSTDEAPMVDRKNYPMYPNDLKKPVWRQKFRLAIDLWRVKHIDYFIPFSTWAGDILEKGCGVPPKRVHPIHVGLDLELWTRVARSEQVRPGRMRILFVGGDFARKGGNLLINVFLDRFSAVAELHLVSRQAPEQLPENVYAYRDLNPNDPRLRQLYIDSDVLVIPTTADTGPLWVFLEAMSTGMPVIGTDTGSNSELVQHGETGFIVPIGNAKSLAEAIDTLLLDPGLRFRMGEKARALIEHRYSAAVNVPRILKVMKDAVDQRRLTDR